MHGISNGTLHEDYRHDWTLLDVHRGDGRIHLSFSRPFETCDDEDYPISVSCRISRLNVLRFFMNTK